MNSTTYSIFNFQLSTQKFMFMKKLTLLTLACSMTLLSFAAGGNITYELNGGVTNDYGWKNKADMLVTLNQDYNTQYNVTSGTWLTWETLDVIMTAGDPVTRIPTFASKMYELVATPKWQWLRDYLVSTVTKQKKGGNKQSTTGGPYDILELSTTAEAYWRYNVSAFFISGVRAGWPASANYTIAGQTDAFMRTWKHAFTGPATYDGTTEINLPTPYKEGFSFGGWFANAEFTGEKVKKIAVGSEGDITLYAKWIDYIPSCEEIAKLNNGTTTNAGGTVSLVTGNTVYIQDVTGGLLIEFTETQTVAPGDLISISGTTAAQGDYKKITNATLTSKETESIPVIQTVSLAALLSDPTPYMFQFVKLEGLTISGYEGESAILVDDANNSISLYANISSSTLPVNTKVNLNAVVSYNSNLILASTPGNVTASPVPRPDPSIYNPIEEGKYTLTSKWLVSNTLDNLSANPIGTNSMVRGMTAKDGKMYFIDREHKQITVVDGATGNKLAPIALASNIFQHVGKDKDGNDSIYTAGTLQYNDIKQDNAGNILISNLITSIAQPFQVWKIDLATGNGTLIVDEILKDNIDFAEATVRFDAFGVIGDVNSSAIIMAANASAMEAYKWQVTNGVAGPAEAVIIATDTEGNFLTNLTNPGSAPQIFPMDENYFYLDGNATLPTLIDMAGEVVDGFFNVPKEVEDWSVGIGNKQGHNGLIEFEMAGEHFFLMASTNTVGTPPSAFRLFKWANANKEFKDIKSLWTLPANGMGAASNPYRTAVPSVEVDEVNKVATLYLYTGENGYGVYEFEINDGSDVKNVNDNNIVKINVNEKTLNFDKQVAHVTVYSIAGQIEVKAKNVHAVTVANNGIYLVKATNLEGETVVHKVIVK